MENHNIEIAEIEKKIKELKSEIRTLTFKITFLTLATATIIASSLTLAALFLIANKPAPALLSLPLMGLSTLTISEISKNHQKLYESRDILNHLTRCHNI